MPTKIAGPKVTFNFDEALQLLIQSKRLLHRLRQLKHEKVFFQGLLQDPYALGLSAAGFKQVAAISVTEDSKLLDSSVDFILGQRTREFEALEVELACQLLVDVECHVKQCARNVERKICHEMKLLRYDFWLHRLDLPRLLETFQQVAVDDCNCLTGPQANWCLKLLGIQPTRPASAMTFQQLLSAALDARKTRSRTPVSHRLDVASYSPAEIQVASSELLVDVLHGHEEAVRQRLEEIRRRKRMEEFLADNTMHHDELCNYNAVFDQFDSEGLGHLKVPAACNLAKKMVRTSDAKLMLRICITRFELSLDGETDCFVFMKVLQHLKELGCLQEDEAWCFNLLSVRTEGLRTCLACFPLAPHYIDGLSHADLIKATGAYLEVQPDQDLRSHVPRIASERELIAYAKMLQDS